MDQNVNAVNVVNGMEGGTTSISTPSTPQNGSIPIPNSNSNVTLTNVTNVTKNNPLGLVLGTRVSTEVYALFISLATKRHLKPGEYLRWIIEDTVHYYLQHDTDRLPITADTPVFVYRELPREPGLVQDARSAAFDSERDALEVRHRAVMGYYEDAQKGKRFYSWVKEETTALIESYKSYHMRVRGLPSDRLEADIERIKALKELVHDCSKAIAEGNR